MAKNGTNRGEKKAQRQKADRDKRQPRLVQVLATAADSLRVLCIGTGLQVLQELMEDDREVLCGPARKKNEQRENYRYGTDRGSVVLGGRKVSVRKPRVRSTASKEVQLPTYEAFSREDPLDERTYEQMVLGVSTRAYERSLEPLEVDVASKATSKSEVSRRFVARTQKQLDDYMGRSLEGIDVPVVMLDGLHFQDHVMLVALGIDRDGRKHVLGVREGTTESEASCRSLLRDLVERGLEVDRARLFVIDGAKGLRKAIRTVFGTWALIARCRMHKLRNILEQLPQDKTAWVRAAVRKAYAASTAEEAESKLLQLATKLEADHPGAAASIREGLDETVTVNRLAISDTLLRSVSSTNGIENLMGTVRRVTRNVKRWRDGHMILRWTATAVYEAQKRFRRVRGYLDMPGLMTSLEALCPAAQLRDREVLEESA